MKGVACDLDSPGFHALCAATKAVIGEVTPYSITGSLPLIRDLKDAGFDVQTCGYGEWTGEERAASCVSHKSCFLVLFFYVLSY